MTLPTSIELNPPSFGWGEETDPIHWRLFKERMGAEKNDFYVSAKELIFAKGPETPMEKLVKDMMPYEDGWDLDYVDKLLYGGPAYVDQDGVGSCVGAGFASAVASKISVELLLEGDPEEPFGLTIQQYQNNNQCAVPLVDYTYGCGKMKSYWNGNKFSRSANLSDGSYCSVHIWAAKTCGILPCSKVLDNGLVYPQSKSIRANAGNNNNEFLNRHLSIGQQHLMGDSTRVKSADDLKEVICVLKQPCMICSGWAFVPQEQVSGLGWIYKKSGSWAHNMSLVACVKMGGNWYVKVRNQWGPNAHKDGWHFWIPLELFSQWVKQAEVESIGELTLIRSEVIPSFPFMQAI